MTPTEVVIALVTAAFADFNPDAARDLMKPDYIQHNPAVPTGAEPLLGVLPALKDSGFTAEPHRIIGVGKAPFEDARGGYQQQQERQQRPHPQDMGKRVGGLGAVALGRSRISQQHGTPRYCAATR